jgi:hypothetical protein
MAGTRTKTLPSDSLPVTDRNPADLVEMGQLIRTQPGAFSAASSPAADQAMVDRTQKEERQ